ncbi:unnamed protein product [Aspergillus oryzae]|uniref:Unnamed protein product n=1 Tax=Aspergillus oryzae TaxID=5062 RepID=A0AAN4YF62_ASPOZ|nr:unnamed protein product [Aspergillus oryzae]
MHSMYIQSVASGFDHGFLIRVMASSLQFCLGNQLGPPCIGQASLKVLSPDVTLALYDGTQSSVLHQITQVVKSLQGYQLPDTVQEYEGLIFDNSGKITSTASTLPCGSPFPTYTEFLREMCIWQSSASDPATHLNGWRDVRNLRQRLDAFFFRCGRSGSHEDPRGEADFDPCGLVYDRSPCSTGRNINANI